MSDKGNVRRPKVDPADARDTNERFLPGQIPVKDAESRQSQEALATEQQPDPAEAAKAVNPELEDTPMEDRDTGE